MEATQRDSEFTTKCHRKFTSDSVENAAIFTPASSVSNIEYPPFNPPLYGYAQEPPMAPFPMPMASPTMMDDLIAPPYSYRNHNGYTEFPDYNLSFTLAPPPIGQLYEGYYIPADPNSFAYRHYPEQERANIKQENNNNNKHDSISSSSTLIITT